MTTENDIAQLLQTQLNNANFTLLGNPAKIKVMEWNLSRPAIFDQYLSRNNQAIVRNDVLVAVRERKSTGSRYIQTIPRTRTVEYEVAVWLLVLDPKEAPAHTVLREQVVNLVIKYFTENPKTAQFNGTFTDDHLSGRSFNFETLIMVTKTLRR